MNVATYRDAVRQFRHAQSLFCDVTERLGAEDADGAGVVHLSVQLTCRVTRGVIFRS